MTDFTLLFLWLIFVFASWRLALLLVFIHVRRQVRAERRAAR